VLLFLCGLVSLCLAATLGLWGYAHYRFRQIATVHIASLKPMPVGAPFNLLIVGSDSRANVGAGPSAAFGNSSQVQGQRSDVTMIVHVDPQLRRVSILSIPRDLVVPIAGTGGSDRINAAFDSGPEQLVQTIENDFSIPVQHYVLVDFSGFESVVNALDGINLDFPYPAKDAYSGLDITAPGCRHLDGSAALAVARSRHYYYLKDGYWQYDGSSDLSRIRRQHVFLQVIARTALDQGLTDPLKANAFIGSIVHDMTIDNTFAVSDMVNLARQMSSIDPASIPTYTFPSQVANNYGSLGDVLLPLSNDDQATVAAFLGIPPPLTSPSTAASPGTTVPGTPSSSTTPNDFDPRPC
jgi:LCP family protein required for cell wall assembly